MNERQDGTKWRLWAEEGQITTETSVEAVKILVFEEAPTWESASQTCIA